MFLSPQSTIKLDGNKLIHNQVGNKDKKEKDSVLIREFTDDKMLMVSLTTEVDDTLCS